MSNCALKIKSDRLNTEVVDTENFRTDREFEIHRPKYL